MPYLAMIDRLRAFLRRPASALVLCGYSFRDEHINEIIVQGLEGSPTAIAFALLHGSVSNYSGAVRLARSRVNLNLLARDGGMIGGQQATWPEREPEAVAADQGTWVRWTPSADRSDGRVAAQFLLGDFEVFGQFLHDLVGTSSRMQGSYG